MTIILRLEGLNVQAGIEDLRAFFDSLRIPEGGVCIVGGRRQEAFIAFSTERDAQLAMRRTGNVLKGSKVTLHISKMEELEHRLETVLKQKKKKKASRHCTRRPTTHAAANLTCLNVRPHDNTTNLSPSSAYPINPDTSDVLPVNAEHVYLRTADIQTSNTQSLDPSAAFILGICTVLQGLQSSHQRDVSNAEPTGDFPSADSTAVVGEEVRTPEKTLNSEPGYVRLFGLPATTTKDDICHFFRGLTVQEAIVNVKLGLNHGCLVKFATMEDACAALNFNQQSLGPFCVDVRGACEKIWNSALQECEKAFDGEEIQEHHQYPLKESVNHKQKSALRTKRESVNQLPSKPPKKQKVECESRTPAVEYIVMVSNLPKKMTKTELKLLFSCPNIPQKNVQHLLNKEGNRTDTAFLIFNRIEDFDYAMTLNGCYVGSNTIEVSLITKEMMREKMRKTSLESLRHHLKAQDPRKKPRKCALVDKSEAPPDADLNAKTCLFVRNMPADVQKTEIKSLFSKYKIRKDNIILLCDSEGSGTGEAVIQFKSEKHVALAQRIHGKDFLGTKVLLTPINMMQMKDILVKYI
ncbi:RNA binding motif protein 12Ba isoform X2 [Archocentrus centrarchus]|nr:RNA-binding protein 12B isoform X2 [Archocentrus centrarchus]XP_030605527.1 RNA-binding protein 12B isoform X2 [Archocentrus centrarchus]